jgi:hypothetical protein
MIKLGKQTRTEKFRAEVLKRLVTLEDATRATVAKAKGRRRSPFVRAVARVRDGSHSPAPWLAMAATAGAAVLVVSAIRGRVD